MQSLYWHNKIRFFVLILASFGPEMNEPGKMLEAVFAMTRLWYYPNPAHKIRTTEAGPPRWQPDKAACPEDITLEERDQLLQGSVSENGDPLDSKRYAVGRESMIFGDRNRFALEIEPIEPSWERRGTSDKGPWARLAIFLRDRCLTRSIEESSSHFSRFVHVPLLPLASWFVQNIRAIAYEESCLHYRSDVYLHEALKKWNETEHPAGYNPESWEDERYAWYQRHFWLSGAEGSIVPDLAFVHADARLWVSWSKPRFAGLKQVEFIEAPGFDSVDWDDAWRALNTFVSYVADEARQRNVSLPAWIRENMSLEEAKRCSAAEYVSFIACDSDEVLSWLRIDKRQVPECSPALQVLRDLDLNSETVHETANALCRLESTLKKAANPSPRLEELRNEACMAREADRPEDAGYDAARWLRKTLGLESEPVEDAALEKVVTDLASVVDETVQSPRNHSAVGMRNGEGACVVLFNHARTRHPWAKRMELARALGHLLLDPCTSEGVLGAGSSQAAQGPRRRRSGTFAAEFILPTSGIFSFLRGKNPTEGSTFEEIMQAFRVGARTAAYQLWNQGFLRSMEDRDWLIEAYGARDTVCSTEWLHPDSPLSSGKM